MEKIDSKYKVYLLLEGSEEEMFFNLVREVGTSDLIELDFLNVGGAENIPAFYQDAQSDMSFDSVLCIFDVDYKYNEQNSTYRKVKNELKLIVGSETRVDAISFCTNPNILQIILLGCDKLANVSLMSTSKPKNTPIVHKYWGEIGRETVSHGVKTTKNYDAESWQLDIIYYSYINKVYKYDTILLNSTELPSNYCLNVPGSNVPKLLEALKNGDIEFFERINKTVKC